MQTHELKPKTKLKKKILVGRGGKRGKTSGRGTKGQNARAGRKKRPEIRTIIKKLPKLRGYRFNSFQLKPTVVTFELIEKVFSVGDVVNPETLSQKGIRPEKGHTLTRVKVLNRGTLTKKINFEKCMLSQNAQNIVTSLGGTVTLPQEKKIVKKSKQA